MQQLINNKLVRYIAAFIIACDLFYIASIQLFSQNKSLPTLTSIQTEIDLKSDEEGIAKNLSNNIQTFRTRPKEGHIIDYTRVVDHCDMSKFLAEQCLEYLDKHESEYTIPNPNLTLNDASKCLPDQPPTLFHVFWKGDFSDKIAMMIKSFMFTQPLQCSKLYVWLDDNEMRLEDNPHAKPLLKFSPKFIEFMKWDTEEQLDHDPIYHGWKSIYHSERRTVSFSDMVRFVVLQRYGGIYVDADVLLLRDLRPFYQTDFEFSYQWSFKEDYNTAVLRLRANSTTTRMVIEGAIQNGMKFHPFDIKKYFVEKLNPTKDDVNPYLYMLPVALFDPLWLKRDNKQPKSILTPNINVWYDVFRPDLAPNEFINVEPVDATPALRKVDGFFPGAFTYHWHNNWKTKILPTSWMGVLQSAYDEFLNGHQPNIYNEYLEF
ncbi:2970_t:CDS:1 [Funneliformis caledonium]|uniref:2970_t:CDS:1 n=1 Tax=Funneliformis caledonium TaxID=1117310 RepID=A0A9N9H8P2_9GLOM|nr:2970_t:CDS:1 [Funneliformis caledonium]